MKKTLKQAVCILTAGILSALLLTGCGCGKKAEETTAAPETQPATVKETQPPETEPETEAAEQGPEGMVRSYLTGQWVPEEIGRRRPVAVMISNVKAAQPSYGLTYADVIYEAPAEASAVRFVAIFERYDDAKEIGSIRSARTYYTCFMQEFESIFFHYGQSAYAKPYLECGVPECVNGVTGASEWAYHSMDGRKSPHHHFTCGDEIKYAIEKMGYSNEYPETYNGHYLFVGDDEKPEMPGATDCNKVTIGYVSNKPWFEYNPEDGLYYRYQFEGPHIDAGNDEQLTTKNIIIQYCDYEHYDTTDYLNIHIWGSGEGQYITDGKVIPITWKKDGDFAITHYYDQNGNEIHLNQGKTWNCVVRTIFADKVVIE